MEETRAELERKVSLCLEVLSLENELAGPHGFGGDEPRITIHELAEELAKLPANEHPEIVRQDWERERTDLLRPRYRVEIAAGLAAQAYNFASTMEMETHLNRGHASEGPLFEAIKRLEEAA